MLQVAAVSQPPGSGTRRWRSSTAGCRERCAAGQRPVSGRGPPAGGPSSSATVIRTIMVACRPRWIWVGAKRRRAAGGR